MDLHQNFWLLLTLFGSSLADITTYVPQLTLKPIHGKVTATTFALEQPQCIFNGFLDKEIWLVVANKSAVKGITDANLRVPVPYSSLQSNGYYHTIKSIGSDYPCSNDQLIFKSMRVGAEAACSDDSFCNGPLNIPGAYRVKFVVLNGNTLLGQTLWSSSITLNTAKSSDVIDAWPGRRSGGMIVITSILSILIGLLLASLVAAIVYGSKALIGVTKTEKKQEPDKEVIGLRKYTTHHSYSGASKEGSPLDAEKV
ncbi:uroplakin-3b [Bombina bombina]|uniref:uroplakin-3b n=1 Tax=Bombina bombina TaxID=8345 RepID=UPI00235A6460|nr:uroplakin-3b [Bombina bombina]